MPNEYVENLGEGQRSVARGGQNRGWRGRETDVVDEPYQAHDDQAEAVEAEHQAVGRLGVAHRVARELLGLLDKQPHDEDDDREDAADGQASAPLGAVEAVLAGCRHDDCLGSGLETNGSVAARWGTVGVDLHGTKAPITKPRSIMLLVKLPRSLA